MTTPPAFSNSGALDGGRGEADDIADLSEALTGVSGQYGHDAPVQRVQGHDAHYGLRMWSDRLKMAGGARGRFPYVCIAKPSRHVSRAGARKRLGALLL
jgi:hypothetical protein